MKFYANKYQRKMFRHLAKKEINKEYRRMKSKIPKVERLLVLDSVKVNQKMKSKSPNTEKSLVLDSFKALEKQQDREIYKDWVLLSIILLLLASCFGVWVILDH